MNSAAAQIFEEKSPWTSRISHDRPEGDSGPEEKTHWLLPILKPVSDDSESETSISSESDIQSITRAKLESICRISEEETFEPGFESVFSRSLRQLITQYPNETLEALKELLLRQEYNAELLSEAVRTLGHMGSGVEFGKRFDLLLEALQHTSPLVRDSAALAMGDLGDTAAIAPLKWIAMRERYGRLREQYERTIRELEVR